MDNKEEAKNEVYTKLEELNSAMKVQVEADKRVAALRKELEELMEKEGVEKVVSEALGVMATLIIREDTIIDRERVEQVLGDRYPEVLSIDRKKVNNLVKTVPQLSEAFIPDRETQFIKVTKIDVK